MLDLKLNRHAVANELERAAKAQEKYWADLIKKNGKTRIKCCSCKAQRADKNMIYLVPLDLYACRQHCIGKIMTPFEKRLRDDS